MRRDGFVYYPVLEAEMGRNGIQKEQIQQLLKIDYSSVSQKVNGRRPFKVDEAIRIQETFFPYVSVNRLFQHD